MHSLAEEVRRRAADDKIIFISGNFNILHPGHLRLFRFAAELGGRLVVGVNADGQEGVTVEQSRRLEDVRSIGMVHEAIALAEEAVDFIARLRPEFVVKGKEFLGLLNEEQGIVDSYGGTILFSSGEVRFNPSELMGSGGSPQIESMIIKPSDFLRRNGFSMRVLSDTLASFKNLKVVVIGDLIVDEYINCDPLGMSREDPTLVVTPVESKRFIGGAGIVASHARGLGAAVTFISIAGDDDAAQFARDQLARQKVDQQIFVDPTRPTTLKQRFRAAGKTLLRVNHLRQLSVSPALQKRLISAAEKALQGADVLLFSDFNYGCLAQSVVERISAFGREQGVLMAADSQASSQMSDISRFKGMSLITPTEHEVRLAIREEEAGLIQITERLQKVADAENLLVTLGAEGMLIYAPKNNTYHTDRLPAFNRAPKDVAGAGDSVFTCAAMALRAGADIWQAAYLGSIAAAWQVSHVGNTQLTTPALLREVSRSEREPQEYLL